MALACLGCRSVPTVIDEPERASPEPAPVEPTPSFRDLFVDTAYGCIVSVDGEIWCWGRGPGWKIGHRPRTDSFFEATPIVSPGPALAVDGDALTTCAALESGKVWCWHWTVSGGGAVEPFRGIGELVDVELDAGWICARSKAGEVHCARRDGRERRRVTQGAVDLALEGGIACALSETGVVGCWGEFASWVAEARERGEPWTEGHEHGPDGELVVARLPGLVELEVGGEGSLYGRFEDGSIRVEPEAEPGHNLSMTAWDEVGVDGAEALAYGHAHGCALVEGKARCFGGDGFGQLGAGELTESTGPVTVAGVEGALLIAASESLSCAATHDRLLCWGTHQAPLPTLDFDEQVPVEVGTEVEAVVATYSSTCVSTAKGNHCFGYAGGGAFAERGLQVSTRPHPLGLGLGPLRSRWGTCFTDAKDSLVCAHFAGATFDTERSVFQRLEGVRDFAYANGPCWIRDGRLRCWGPGGVDERRIPALRKPTAIAGGQSTLCAIHDGGELVCFPLRSYEQPELLEVATELGPAVQLLYFDSGYCFAAVDQAGAIDNWCFDAAGAPEPSIHPNPRFDPVAKLVPTRDGLCALTKDGRVQCQNYEDYDVITPELGEVIDISADQNHWCVLRRDRSLACLGDNRWGQLGVLPSSYIAEPTRIVLEG